MTPILQDDGDLLVPVGECVAAEAISTGDPRYVELLAESVAAAGLRGTSEEDAALLARFERSYRGQRPRSA
jgi:hypothetical protein